MKISALTDTGMVRASNQDYFYTSDVPVGPVPNLILLADGMGGHKAGDTASRVTVETMVSTIAAHNQEDPLPIILSEGIYMANETVLRMSQEDEALQGMGTTLVAAVMEKDLLTVANIGDSRLYLFRNEELLQITKDHSYVAEMIAKGLMKPDSPEYKMYKNLITRAIGAAKSTVPDFFEVEMLPGDIFLLCSDGLTNMVMDEEIRLVLCSELSLEEKTSILVHMANENGGTDNVTVVLAENDCGKETAC